MQWRPPPNSRARSRPGAGEAAPQRDLSRRLGDADWLDGAFSAGDLMMITVLRRLSGTGVLDRYPGLTVYVARGESRPAFKRAFDAQRAVFNSAVPAG